MTAFDFLPQAPVPPAVGHVPAVPLPDRSDPAGVLAATLHRAGSTADVAGAPGTATEAFAKGR